MPHRSPPSATSGPRATRARPVVAKFRTGPTPTWPWPDEAELAAFLRLAASAEAPFKLTGGLHHAVRGTYPVDGAPEEHHGILNVLLATAAAGRRCRSTRRWRACSALRDGEALAELVRRMARRDRGSRATGVHVLRLLHRDRPGGRARRPRPPRPALTDRPDQPRRPENRHDLARPARRPPVRRPQPAVRRLLHPGCRPARRRPRGRRGARRRCLRGAGRDGVRCRLARAVAQPLPRGGAPGVDRGARVAHRAADERGAPRRRSRRTSCPSSE